MNKIFVTKPNLPPLDEYVELLQEIWSSRVLSNAGPFNNRLEESLAAYLGVSDVVLFNNATIALIAALKVMNITGEVITTPFSFAATSAAIRWCNLEPVFVDVEPKTGNIDPRLVKEAISPRTAAILPVHCYGNPCDFASIDSIAEFHKLQVLYDAAHVFGSNLVIRDALLAGRFSVISFHATKIFNTFEGGCVIAKCADDAKRLREFRNFGFGESGVPEELGLNGKLNEASAALGLLNLKYISAAIEGRQRVDRLYRSLLNKVDGVTPIDNCLGEYSSFSYFPVRFPGGGGGQRDLVYERLLERGIVCRKYFFPLLPDMQPFKVPGRSNTSDFPCASLMANETLCLPLYPDLGDADVTRIVNELVKSLPTS